jgi:hypothetical protein
VASWRCPRVNVGSAEHDATVTTFLRVAAGGNLSYLAWARAPAAWLCVPAMMSSAGCTTG